MDKFKVYFRRMLEAFPKASFLATSLPYGRYFWSRTAPDELTPTERAIEDFIAAGGEFSRLFFVDDGDLRNSEVLSTLRNQRRIGVRVLVGDSARVPARLQEFFVVDADAAIGWKIDLTPRQTITNFRFTIDRTKLRRYHDRFLELLEHPAVGEWTDDQPAGPNVSAGT